MSRQLIRAALRSLIEADQSAIAYEDTRIVDATNYDDYIHSYFNEGVVNGGYVTAQQIDADLVVSYSSIDATDEELDNVLDSIEAAIVDGLSAELNTLGFNGLHGIQKTGFSYDTPENTSFNRLAYLFQVTYLE